MVTPLFSLHHLVVYALVSVSALQYFNFLYENEKRIEETGV